MIESRVIIGLKVPAAPAAMLRERIVAEIRPRDEISCCVFESRVDGVARYCCWAGGHISPTGEPMVTPIGNAAVETMLELPFLAASTFDLVFQEVTLGRTPLQKKVISAFRNTADAPTLLVFVGDLAGALDGHMGKAFNWCGSIQVEDCIGFRKPGVKHG